MKPPLKKNDEPELKIEALSSEGSGIGRCFGFTVFVPGTAVGDRVAAHVIKVKQNYAVAKLKKVLCASSDRIELDCPVFAQCGGCAFRHIRYEAEVAIKRQRVEDALRRIGGIETEVREILTIPDPDRYRNKALIPVSQTADGKLLMGFYANRSHRVVNCRDCLLQPAEFRDILQTITVWITRYGISVYDEAAQTGLLRHIYLRKGFATGEIMVCPVVSSATIPHLPELCEALTQAHPEIKSILLNVNPDDTNVVLGEETKLLWGKDHIEDVLCGLRFQISPLSFYQVNPVGAELLYRKAAEFAALTGEETLLDLYCGAGTIGLSMASQAKRVIGVEIISEAIENAKENAARNGISNASFFCGDASQAAARFKEEGLQPDVIVLDPPRKGCSEDLIRTAAEMAPRRIVYVSCDPATLARDCKRFGALGYTVQQAAAVDMFPRTAHVETVVLLVRKTPDLYIDFKIDLDERNLTSAETAPTYDDIKAFVLKTYGLKVSALYISQVKRKLGLEVGEAYNKPKTDQNKTPQCPEEKEQAIVAALKYYKMI